jgi:hypothetical protein
MARTATYTITYGWLQVHSQEMDYGSEKMSLARGLRCYSNVGKFPDSLAIVSKTM